MNLSMRRSMTHLIGIAWLTLMLSITALAQTKAPTEAPIATPDKASPAKSLDEAIGTSGTTIIGDQESPIGLYITPWKDEYAEGGLDRPARLLDEAMEPIDPASFRRQIEYYETITRFRRSQQGAVARPVEAGTPTP